MTELRPGTPLTIREAAKAWGVRPRTLKRQLRAHEERTGERVTLRLTPRGPWMTSLGLARRVFGDDFGREPTDAERLAKVEHEQALTRRDVAGLARQFSKIVSMVTILLQRAGITPEQGPRTATEQRLKSTKVDQSRHGGATDKLRGT